MFKDGVLVEVKMELGRIGMRFLYKKRDCISADLLYAADLVLCGEEEENLCDDRMFF